MNNTKADRLYNLLPAIYRIRDAETGWQLQALLRVITEQVDVVEADIAQLYQNWFIETCQDWIVPYIGDLIGYQQVHEAGEPGDVTTQESRERNDILIPRRDVANTLHYRRRRGTLALLEQLARDVAGWPYAHVVELYKYLGITQNSNFGRGERGHLIDVRDSATLYTMGSPFASEAHTVDIRRPLSQHATGRYNIPSVGLFIWRLKVYPVTKTHAYHDREGEGNHFIFSALGNDTPLYTHPASRQTVNGQLQAVDELNFPQPISLRSFEKRLTDYYGNIQEGKSLEIWTVEATHPHREHEERHEHREREEHHEHRGHEEEHRQQEHEEHHEHGARHGHEEHREERREQHGHHEHHTQYTVQSEHHVQATTDAQPPSVPAPTQPAPRPQPQLVEPSRIIAADLSGWKYVPRPGYVAVDTQLGRIAFPKEQVPREVYVSYYYAFSTDMGGGAYKRTMVQPVNAQLFKVQKDAPPLPSPIDVSDPDKRPIFPTLKDALAAWQQWKTENGQSPQPEQQHGLIEIRDDGFYAEQLTIDLEENEYLTIRAANRKRPILRVLEPEEDDDPDALVITGEYGSRFTLDGLLLTGRPLRFEGTIDTVRIRHCTLIPGHGIDSDCNPRHPEEPSMVINHKGTKVTIEQSIVGALEVYQDEVREEPLHIDISDSILDATSEERNALNAPEHLIAYAILNISRSTVFGRVLVHAIDTAENSILQGAMTVARRQRGCMRFCSIVPGSRTPRRYHCQPDLVDQAIDIRLKGQPAQVRDEAKQLEHDRVRPRFNSVRYGQATYCQLSLVCASEIRSGADDQSEMGVFHDLFSPQREANLRARLDDFTPAGMETGIIYVS
jgi:hypothetical protein